MAFPQSVLPVRVRIAPGASPAGDPALWQWVDITQYVRVASGITVTAGQADEGAKVDPGKCQLTVDNRDGRFVPRNVLGPWYGQLAKGTPLRFGTIAVSDTFTRVRASGFGPTDTGQTWAHTGTSLWSVNGTVGQYSVTAAGVADLAVAIGADLIDFDAQHTVSVPAVMTGASHVSALIFRYQDTGNYLWASAEFNTGGTVTAKIRATTFGITTDLATTGNIAGLTYTANQKLRLRVQADGVTVRVKVWQDGGTEPVPWNLTLTTGWLVAGPVGFYEWSVSGNTNTKPYAVSVDDLEVEKVEFTGAVYEWPPRWDKSRKDVTVPITASGPLRRLQQGKSPLRSAITRMMLRQSPVALFPFEDDNDSTVAASALPGGTPATVRAVEFAQNTPVLYGAQQTTGVTASTVVTWKVGNFTSAGTWAVVWFAQLLAPPAATTKIMSVNTTGTVRRWDVLLDSVGYYLQGYDSNGTQIYTSSALYSSLAIPPAWIAFDLLVKQSGGTVDAKLLMYGVDPNNLGTAVFFGTTVSGSVGVPTGGRFEGSLGFNGGRAGALAVFAAEPQFVGGEFAIAANGYIGELAADRVQRLCDEQGVSVYVEDGDSEPLGPQRTDTFLNLLYAAEAADHGILYERGTGLAYRPRGARFNRPVEFALDFSVGDVAEPPEPTDDDQQLKNQWTVSRDNGSFAVAADAASIDQSDLLDDSVTINVATDAVLPYHAGWQLATTTVDELRWPSIKLNLARNTGQIRLWRKTQPFPRLTIANEPSQITGNAVDITVLGYSQTFMPFGWDIDLNCAPSTPWGDIGVYDATAERYAAEDSTLSAGVSAGATTLVVTFPRPSGLWSTDATDQPYDLVISGEQIRVPVGGMGAVTGSGPYTQTITGATRAINGISKALLAGADVQVANPGRYAL
jgi:hypothetical protein